MPPTDSSSVDIFGLLDSKEKEEPKKEQSQRQELLSTTKVKDLFPEGKITVNRYTCIGVQCKLCIKVCPTNALYWSNEGVGIIDDLCVHCHACVLSCMVPECIKIDRKRSETDSENFGKISDIVSIDEKLNAKKRVSRVNDMFSSWEDYCDKYCLTR
jgi:NAD-dependent dihydropyrimidine dehydrogenase PreA subunit